MLFSAFTPCDLLEFSADPPEAEKIYDSMISNLGGQYGLGNAPPAVGTREEATCYAQSLQIARARKRLRQAAAQRLPSKVFEQLPQREAEYGVVPGPNDSIATRRATLAARKLLPTGASTLAITTALQTLLGSDFIAYRPLKQTEAALDPATCGAWPMNLQRPDVTRKVVKLVDGVSFINTPVTVLFTTVSTRGGASLDPQGQQLKAGDVLVFDVGKAGQQDRVTVTAVVPKLVNGLLTATFTRPHESGVYGYTHPLPSWQSTKRQSLIVLTPSAAQDPQKRRKVHALMKRMARAVSTWSIVAGTSTAVQQMTLASGLGFTTLSPFSLP